jgi:hypothetical protein
MAFVAGALAFSQFGFLVEEVLFFVAAAYNGRGWRGCRAFTSDGLGIRKIRICE